MHLHAFKTAVISSALMLMTVGSASAADKHRPSSTARAPRHGAGTDCARAAALPIL